MGNESGKMNRKVLLLLSFLPLAAGRLTFSEDLCPDGAVVLQWELNKTTENITFEVQGKTNGWVSFGLSPGGGMEDADIVIGGVDPSNNPTPYFSDYHGVGQTRPVLDDTQNYLLLSLSENGTHTSMRFSRKFRTGDPFDVDITEETIRVITAYGMTDTIGYHGTSHRCIKPIKLLRETSVSRGGAPVPS